MAYTATKYLTVKPLNYPYSYTYMQKMVDFQGVLLDCDTATNYSTGGIGSSSFEVTAFSAVGLVTYSALKGLALINGERVVIFNTSSNTNDGTYIVSAITTTSSTAGTFIAVPIGLNTLSGSAQTSQTAEGVGQLLFGNRQTLQTTLTITTVTAVTGGGGLFNLGYTTLSGPQLFAAQGGTGPGGNLVVTGMTNTANNGTFPINAVSQTSSTAGTIQIVNPSGVATDSGSGTFNTLTGIEQSPAATNPVVLDIYSTKGYVYQFDQTNYTLRIFLSAGSNAVMPEAGLGATVAFDNTIFFKGRFIKPSYGT